MIKRAMAGCLVGMFILGSLWLVAELVDTPQPKNVVMSEDEIVEVSELMRDALDELKRRQEGN